jgi:hypothetical protein
MPSNNDIGGASIRSAFLPYRVNHEFATGHFFQDLGRVERMRGR